MLPPEHHSMRRNNMKLFNNPWLIRPEAHSLMLKQMASYMDNPMPVNPVAPYLKDNNEVETAEEIITGDSIAIVSIGGILAKNVGELEEALGMISVDEIKEALEKEAFDPSVKSIILDCSSPGGETTGILELGETIRMIDENIKPVYCWTSNQADSACYWLYSQGRYCGMTRSAQVGSVGVYILVVDSTEQMKKEGIKIEAITSKKSIYKLLGHEFHSMTDEERNILQTDVDKQYEKFKAVIKSKRPHIDDDDLNGLSYEGDVAFDKGFTDILCNDLNEFISIVNGKIE
jgi:signal peptide peptidase SppA